MTPASIYETADLVDQYLLFHYGKPEEILPYEFGPADALDFPVRCVLDGFDLSWTRSPLRALDLGCAVGRSSFELSRLCSEVVAIDWSQAFITAAEAVRSEGRLEYLRADEGPIRTRLVARPPAGCHPERIHFRRGDALEVEAADGKFDLVLAANLIDRVSNPETLLKTFAERVTAGGQVVITSPYTWLTDFTPENQWLASVAGGQNVTSLERMKQILAPDFRLAETKNFPFLIREHARKFQWSVAQLTRWVRG